jgi:hypothetical protein
MHCARSALASLRRKSLRGNRRRPHKILSAAPRATVGTNRGSAVSGFRYGRVAAWRPYVVVTVYMLDSAVHETHSDDFVALAFVFGELKPETLLCVRNPLHGERNLELAIANGADCNGRNLTKPFDDSEVAFWHVSLSGDNFGGFLVGGSVL